MSEFLMYMAKEHLVVLSIWILAIAFSIGNGKTAVIKFTDKE